eukprot:Em0109g5a
MTSKEPGGRPQSVEELKDKEANRAYCIAKDVKASSPGRSFLQNKKVAGASKSTRGEDSERLAVLQAIQKAASIFHDESTGQGIVAAAVPMDTMTCAASLSLSFNCLTILDAHAEHGGVASAIQEYIKQIEELKLVVIGNTSLGHESKVYWQPRATCDSKSRLVMSETMSEQNPKSPYHRMVGHHMSTAPSSLGVVSHDMRTEELLEAAKSNIHKLKEKEDNQNGRSMGMSAESTLQGNLLEQRRDQGTQVGPPTPMSHSKLMRKTESSFEDVTSEEEVLHSMSSSEEDEDTVSLASSVAELSQEIKLKQQLVDQLEKNLHSIKQQYEEKMQVLQQQSKSIEVERMLKEIANRREERNEEKAKEVRARYEKELSNLKVQQENELKRLKADLLEMKKQRVKMLNQMRTEATTKKLEDQRKSKKIAQLKKDSQKKECRIKSLEADAKRREFVLKRRQEEVCVEKEQVKDNSICWLFAHGKWSNVFSFWTAPPPLWSRESEGAKKKWRDLERKVLGTIMRRKTVNVMSSDMDHWIEKRGELSKHLDELKGQRARLMEADKVDSDEVTSVDEDLDSVTANIEYVQQNILELQNELIAVEDARTGEGDTVGAHSIIIVLQTLGNASLLSVPVGPVMLEHPPIVVVSPEHSILFVVSPEHCIICMVSPEHLPSPQGVTAQQKEADVKALEAQLKASEHSVEVITSLSTPQLQPPLSASRTITKSSSHLVIPQGLPPPPLLLHDTESTSSEDGKHSDSSSEVSSAVQSRPRSSSHGRASDRTVKAWDLKTSTELLTLDRGEKHLSYVRSIKYCPHTRLIFTASQNIIKIWDMRNHKAQCVKTFGSPTGSSDAVQDLLVFGDGGSLFSASGNIVNIWDLQKMVHVGKLTGHNAGVSSLAVLNNLLITGSRDRLIKLFGRDAVQFDVVPTAGVVVVTYPLQHTLQPPHYDAVTSFVRHEVTELEAGCGWGPPSRECHTFVGHLPCKHSTAGQWM